jgi:hypothetical protein
MDHLSVANAWSKEKEEYLPYNYKLNYIREQLESRFIYLQKKFEFIDEEINKDRIEEGVHEDTKMVLTNMSKQYKIDITVVGFHGRKGPKEDPTVMGTAVQYMSVHSFNPTMIVKKQILRSERPDGYTLSLCCDGSKKAMQALDLMCRMRSNNDTIHVMICEQKNINTGIIEQTVNDILEEANCLENS